MEMEIFQASCFDVLNKGFHEITRDSTTEMVVGLYPQVFLNCKLYIILFGELAT